jgi:hypothetical protein
MMRLTLPLIPIKPTLTALSRLRRHYLNHPTTRSNPELIPAAIDPVVYKPKTRDLFITTFARKLKATLLKKVGARPKTRGGGPVRRLFAIGMDLASLVLCGGDSQVLKCGWSR